MYGRVAISDRMIYGLKSREAEFMILEELRRAGIDHVTRRYPLAHDCVTIFEGPLTDEAVMRHVMKGRAEGISKAIKDGKVTKTGRFIDLTRKR